MIFVDYIRKAHAYCIAPEIAIEFC